MCSTTWIEFPHMLMSIFLLKIVSLLEWTCKYTSIVTVVKIKTDFVCFESSKKHIISHPGIRVQTKYSHGTWIKLLLSLVVPTQIPQQL